MSFLKAINDSIPVKATTYPVPVRTNTAMRVQNVFDSQLRMVGNDIVLYPQDNGQRYIDQGYKKNDGVYSICSTNAEKAAQVRLYHVKVKREEKKTLQEYLMLQKGALNEKVIKELTIMRRKMTGHKSMTEDYIVDSPVSKLLNKPNRAQTQSQWIENIFLNWDLQGEGNIWFSRLDENGPPMEMFIIPKQHLNLVGNGRDPWEIVEYQFVMDAINYRWRTEDVVMWKHTNPAPLSRTLEHLRGMAPLEAFMVPLQAMNEADVRVATSNKSGGANGFAFRTDLKGEPSTDQKTWMRQQFDSIVNNPEMVNKIAALGGEWGYFNIGQSVRDQQLLDQYNISFVRLCRVFKTPAQIFDAGNGTWDNQARADRRWIYSKIAPSIYQLKGLLSDKLIREFGLDPETNLIDCDPSALPELAEDMKDQVAAVKDATWLSINEKRSATSYEPLEGDEYNYVPSEDIGSSLNNDLTDLGE